LIKAGYQVDLASNGLEAVQATKDNVYDVVLMDVQMPVLDGVEATRRIRNLHGPSRLVPIVALTANVLPDQIKAFRLAGFNDHVGKPFKAAELVGAVERWCSDITMVQTDPALDDARVLDEAVYLEICELLGQERTSQLLNDLREHLMTSFLVSEAGHPDLAKLAASAHATISAAGMLGFRQLSNACRVFEEACLAGRDPSKALLNLVTAKDYASTAIDRAAGQLQTAHLEHVH
jgi:CheY-like chemotaxis protein